MLFRGGGDLASASINRLYKCGYKIVVSELKQPLVVRRTVSYASCIYDKTVEIENVIAKYIQIDDENEIVNQIHDSHKKGVIPVLNCGEKSIIDKFKPDIFIDATLSKRDVDYRINHAPFVIGLGPNINAGVDADVVIETNRGHYLGKLIYKGYAEKNTGIPGSTLGKSYERVLRASLDGSISIIKDICSEVLKDDIVAKIGEEYIRAPISGIIRGMIADNTIVRKGLKIGDIDPRADKEYCYTISDKARAIAGSVLEAIIVWERYGK